MSVPLLFSHDRGCPYVGKGHTDAARRISDTFTLHKIAGGYEAIGKWFVVSLQDGTTDNVLYDSRRDAMRHQMFPEHHGYYTVTPGQMSVCAAEALLRIARRLYEKGIRMIDPDEMGGREPIKRSTWEDMNEALKGNTLSNLSLKNGE